MIRLVLQMHMWSEGSCKYPTTRVQALRFSCFCRGGEGISGNVSMHTRRRSNVQSPSYETGEGDVSMHTRRRQVHMCTT